MEKENKIILAFPRSGTKLLANIYTQQGYHNFGEFFNSYSSTIIDSDPPYAVRLPIDQQNEIDSQKLKRGSRVNSWTHTLITEHRISIFEKFKDITPSIVTVWIATFNLLPESVNLLNTRSVLCLRRRNKFEQLLSRCLTLDQYNHDNEIPSTPRKIDADQFNHAFKSLLKLEKLQDYCVNNLKGQYVDFDSLVLGNADLGFTYTIDTTDQHTDLESLVLNLDEIKKRYKILHELYNVGWDI